MVQDNVDCLRYNVRVDEMENGDRLTFTAFHSDTPPLVACITLADDECITPASMAAFIKNRNLVHLGTHPRGFYNAHTIALYCRGYVVDGPRGIRTIIREIENGSGN